MFNKGWFRVEVKDPEKYQRDKAVGRLYGLSTGLVGSGVFVLTENIPLALGAIGVTSVAVYYYIKRKSQAQ